RHPGHGRLTRDVAPPRHQRVGGRLLRLGRGLDAGVHRRHPDGVHSAGTLRFITLIVLILPGFTSAMFGGFNSMIGTFLGGLALVTLIGWTGQINLAPLAFAGIGAFTSAILSTSAHLPFWAVIPLTGLVTIPVAVLIGIPALRLRGFYLALATMAFAFAAEQWLFTQSFLSSRNQFRPSLGLRADLTQPAYLMSLLCAAILFIGVRNLNRTGTARAFQDIRA